MTPEPELTIVVCTYQRAELLIHSLNALAGQTLDPARFELLIVDNNSPDHTAQVVAQFRRDQATLRVRYALEKQQGLSHARNRGYREAQGRYVAYIDDDARADPDWAARILRHFTTMQPQPFCVGGKYLPWYETPPPAWFTDDFETRTWGETEGFLTGKRQRFGLSGSNMAYPKDILENYGGFPTNPGIMQRNLGEETYLNYEIFKSHPERRDRLFYYDPKLIVHHWTTAHNADVAYRLARAFKGGVSIAFIEGSRPTNWLFWKTVLLLGTQLLKYPFRLLIGPGTLKARWLRATQDLYTTVGYLWGSLSGA
ncbi:MAG: glycosyltransferase [Cytophagaceae bacterium]|nr:glycosyltransferase [Cytophagaceae bacterium]